MIFSIIVTCLLSCNIEEDKKTTVPTIEENSAQNEVIESYDEEYEEEPITTEANFKNRFSTSTGSYVIAENGLLCRDKPNGEVIHKFSYGEELQIINYTDEKLTIVNDWKEISGNWVEVAIPDTDKTGYVFDGFLESMTLDLDVEKIASLMSPSFMPLENQNGLILDGKHNVYDENLDIIRQININSISEVTLLSATKFERPETKEEAQRDFWQDYCTWANYIKITYNNEQLIVFGSNILQISNEGSYDLNDSEIIVVFGNSFIKQTSTLTEELSGCMYGTNLLINSDGNYSFLYNYKSVEKESLFFNNNEGSSEEILNTHIKNDTIYSTIDQSFQEGVGAYKLKVFKNDGWKFIEYDRTRDYDE